MIKATSIDSLTNFQKNAKSFTNRLEETKEALVLTVNGKAKLVVQDADAYQALVDEVERSRFIDAVRQGLAESELGLGRPAEVSLRRDEDQIWPIGFWSCRQRKPISVNTPPILRKIQSAMPKNGLPRHGKSFSLWPKTPKHSLWSKSRTT